MSSCVDPRRPQGSRVARSHAFTMKQATGRFIAPKCSCRLLAYLQCLDSWLREGQQKHSPAPKLKETSMGWPTGYSATYGRAGRPARGLTLGSWQQSERWALKPALDQTAQFELYSGRPAT
jgi:hypothetical protein